MGASGGTRLLGFAGHLSVRTSAGAGQDGIRTACARWRVLLVDDLVDSCPSDLDYILRAHPLRVHKSSLQHFQPGRPTLRHLIVAKDVGTMRAAHRG